MSRGGEKMADKNTTSNINLAAAEELHACLLSFLADELPTLGVLTDMVRVQFLYIYIG